MSKLMNIAFNEVATLSEADQDIGKKILLHVKKLRELRAAINKSLKAIGAGEVYEFNPDEFFRRAKLRFDAKN